MARTELLLPAVKLINFQNTTANITTGVADFTDLDLSSSVGKHAALCTFLLEATGDATNKTTISLRTNGRTDAQETVQFIGPTAATLTKDQVDVWTDDNGIVEYNAAVQVGTETFGITLMHALIPLTS